MATSLLLWLLYLLACAAATLAALWLKRPIALPFFLAFLLLPVLFLLPGFIAEKTIFPVDHVLSLPPWADPDEEVEAHNQNLNDIATQIAPWAKAVRMAWKEGSLPLRNRWNAAGSPLAGNGQSAAFSPLTILMFALPLAKAFTLLAALKLFLALSGTWLWLKEIGASPEASLFGAAVFAFSLTMTPWLLFPHTAVICLWPWVLFSIELLRREETRRRGFWALAALFLLWAVNGHPESAASGAAFTGLWLLSRRALGDLPDFVPVLRRLSLCALAAVGLSAFLLLPQVLAIRASNRIAVSGEAFYAPIFSWAPHGPAWRNGLFTAFFPRLFGDGVDSPMIEGGAGSFSEMALAYFGIVGWACFFLALRPGSARSRTERSLLVPLLSGFFAAIGLWPFAEIAGLVPALRLMFPLRFFSWVALAGAAIGAFELDRLKKDLAARRLSASLFPIGVAAALAVFALAAHAHFRERHTLDAGLPSQREAWTVLFAALAALVLSMLAVNRWRARFPLLLALALVSSAELFAQGTRLYHFGRPRDLYPPTPPIEFLRAQEKPFRVAGQGAALFPHTNIFAEVEDIRSHDPVERRDYVEFLDATAGYPPAAFFKQIGNLNAPSLDFLNVRFLIAPHWHSVPGEKWKLVHASRNATVFENTRALPRVFAPRIIRIVERAAAERRLPPSNAMTAFGEAVAEMKRLADWGETAFVLTDAGRSSLWPEGPQPEGIEVADYRESTNAASFRARNPTPDTPVVLVASLVQDGGWSAENARGEALPATLANGPFLAISLPPGEHRVALAYSPPGFRAGSGISLATAAACALALASRLIRRRSPGSSR